MNKCFGLRITAALTTIAAALFLLFSNATPAFAGKSVNLLSYTNHNGTDDQTGIMNAFNAAGPYGKVMAPAGYTWLHSGQLVAPPGLSLVGGGTSAILKATNNSAGALVFSSGSSVFNLTIEYANPSGSSPPYPGYPDPNLSASGIVIQSATKVSVLTVNIPSTSDNSIAVVGSNNVSISNCQIGAGFSSGVLIANSYGVQVTGNTFSSQVVNIVSSSFCAVNNNTFINTNGAVNSSIQVANSQFNNNIIQNGSKGAYADFYLTGQTTNVEINGNTMEMVPGSTITAATLWLQAIFIWNLGSVSNLSGVTISNNSINGGCPYQAIYIAGAGTNVNVSKNTLTNIGTNCLNSATVPGEGGITWSTCSGSICGNTFNKVNASAINISSSPYNSNKPPPASIQIANNTASNCYIYKYPSFFLNSPAYDIAVILLQAGNYNSVSTKNNSYTGGGNPGYFIDCWQPGVQESGNNGGLLPSYYAP